MKSMFTSHLTKEYLLTHNTDSIDNCIKYNGIKFIAEDF